MGRRGKRHWSLVVCGAALAFPGAAAAQSAADPVAARALFQDARKLVAAKQYEQACPKFEESLKLDPGIGTMFNLGDCWEHVGRTASAWSEFLDAASAAKNAGQADREKVARQRAAGLEAHLSRLTIGVAAPDAGLVVHDGTRTVEPSVFGVAIPVDPGSHTIEATAPGKKPWQSVVQVAPDGASVTLAVPALATDETATASAAAPVPAAPPPAPAAENDVDRPAGSTQRTAGWITGGVGVAGVVVGAVFGLVASSKNSQAKGLCPTLACPNQGDFDQHASLVDSAKTARTVAIVGFAAGGAALIGGTVLIVTAHKRPPRDALRFAPVVGAGQWGASFAADF